MQIKHNISLKPFNTFAVNVQGRRIIILENEQEIPYLFKDKIFEEPYLILGGGSNVLFTKDFEGTIIQLRSKGIEKVQEGKDDVVLKVAAGEKWEDFVLYCIKHHYYGAENLIAIPGWVGSSPVQNIGAYGVEVKDVIEKVEGFDIETGMPVSFTNAECEFDYRSSIFKTRLKNKILITNVYYRLSKKEQYVLTYSFLKDELETSGQPLSLANVAEAVTRIRNRKLPDVRKIGSAGSFFKNPVIGKEEYAFLVKEYPTLSSYAFKNDKVKLAAGQLIELCGWKGFKEGEIGVYPQQALVLVNYGAGTGAEIAQLASKIQNSVQEKFGVSIEPEVNII